MQVVLPVADELVFHPLNELTNYSFKKTHHFNSPTILWSTQQSSSKEEGPRHVRDSLSLQEQEQTQNDGMNDHTSNDGNT